MISEKHHALLNQREDVASAPDRLIGICRASCPGPTLICFGGIHGNEPAGVRALESVFADLGPGNAPLSQGCFVGIRGNLPALEEKVRFLGEDMNRLWTRQRIQQILAKGEGARNTEEKEFAEILGLIKRLLDQEQPPFYFVALHTTSSPTLPFVTINDAVINRKFSSLFPVPVILGIEADIAGLWTVPVERQARYLGNVEAQLAALVESERLRVLGMTKRAFVQAISLALRLALRVMTP